MKKRFQTTIFGYKKGQVDVFIDGLYKDYEDELSKKKDRMMELTEENRRLKLQIQDLEQRISGYMEQEAYISKAIIKAEQKAQDILDDGCRKAVEELCKLDAEKTRWKIRSSEVRKQLLEFEKEVCSVMELFRSEINYLTSKEVNEMHFFDEIDKIKDCGEIVGTLNAS
jgi:cell division initiation protein